MSHIHPSLVIKASKKRGRGVFALNGIEANTLVEISPVIILDSHETKIIHNTILHDYYFIWGHQQNQSAIGLGYISLYNHSPNANCYHECDFDDNTISIYSKCFIPAEEELHINYMKGEENPLWFKPIYI